MDAPEQMAVGIYRIDGIGLPAALNLLVAQGADGWSLVDTGTSGSPKRIQSALASLGVGPGDLARIYLTHHHQDHVGGLPAMRRWAPKAEIVAPAHEAEIITGRRPADPFSNPVFRRLQTLIRLPVVAVDRTVNEGDSIGPFKVVASPGHTFGHTSLLAETEGLLFTGDAFGAMPRRLRVGVRGFLCTAPALARGSASKLLGLSFKTVVFAHGPAIHEGAKERLSQVVAACDYR